MATSGTYTFNPPTANLGLQAFARIGIRRTELTPAHLMDLYNEANLVQVELGNRLPNMWLDELYEQVLEEGTATYTLTARLTAFQAPVISIDSGDIEIDRLIYPYTTLDYAAIPNKLQRGPPTTYWLNMLATPTITFWPVPDGNAEYTFKVRMLRQMQDAILINGVQTDLPYRWLDVYVAKLAHRMSRIYARDLEQARKMDAEEAWTYAATNDKEPGPVFLRPQLDSYWS